MAKTQSERQLEDSDVLVRLLERQAYRLDADPASVVDPAFQRRGRQMLLVQLREQSSQPRGVLLPFRRTALRRSLAGLALAAALVGVAAVPVLERPAAVAGAVSSALGTIRHVLRGDGVEPNAPAAPPPDDVSSRSAAASATAAGSTRVERSSAAGAAEDRSARASRQDSTAVSTAHAVRSTNATSPARGRGDSSTFVPDRQGRSAESTESQAPGAGSAKAGHAISHPGDAEPGLGVSRQTPAQPESEAPVSSARADAPGNGASPSVRVPQDEGTRVATERSTSPTALLHGSTSARSGRGS